MIRLETVEDFEKVREALDNPKSRSYQFCIKNFGYCTACKTITQYEGHYSIEDCSETCLRCKRIFRLASKSSPVYDYLSSDQHQYLTEDNIPVEVRVEFNRLHSREFQLRVFRIELDRFIKKLKREARSRDRKVRRLAKLRG